MKATSICAAGAVLAIFAVATTPALAACKEIKTAAQAQAMKGGNLAEDYCLRTTST